MISSLILKKALNEQNSPNKKTDKQRRRKGRDNALLVFQPGKKRKEKKDIGHGA